MRTVPKFPDASKLGAEHFNRHYGKGAKYYKEGSPDFFDIESFATYKSSPYKNPRRNDWNEKAYAITGGKRNGFYYSNAIIWWLYSF